jgi:hypothetical protein
MAPIRMDAGGKAHYFKGRTFYLFGLVHGHFDVKNLNEDVVADSESDASGSINAGMAVVIPIEKIMETINHPDFLAERMECATRDREATGATPDAVQDVGEDLPASDENPTHLEDFTSLLNEAARKRPQGDQT